MTAFVLGTIGLIAAAFIGAVIYFGRDGGYRERRKYGGDGGGGFGGHDGVGGHAGDGGGFSGGGGSFGGGGASGVWGGGGGD